MVAGCIAERVSTLNRVSAGLAALKAATTLTTRAPRAIGSERSQDFSLERLRPERGSAFGWPSNIAVDKMIFRDAVTARERPVREQRHELSTLSKEIRSLQRSSGLR